MIAREREEVILNLLGAQGVISMQAIMARCRGISAVTLRRDLSRLERLGKLSRTRGGAVGMAVPVAAMPDAAAPGGEPQEFDALILPPVKGQWAHTLRQQVARRRAILIAESAPQVGGIYLGPRNFEGARALGRFAGHEQATLRSSAEVLLVALEGLPNTRERVEGFSAGFAETFPGTLVLHRVDGRGLLKEVIRQAGDAFAAHPGIDVVFGVNDHTILGALDVAERAGLAVIGYSVGGEGGSLFDKLAAGGALSAVLALFPEVVGRVAIDTICRVTAGEAVGSEVITPAEVVTARSLPDYYQQRDQHWRLRPEVQERMCAPHAYQGPAIPGRSIGFMLHYPSHEWYRSLAAEMGRRAAEVGATFVARNAEDEVAEELRGIKRTIGRAAAAQIRPRETLLLDGGECSRGFAAALRAAGTEVSIYTNALAVLDILAGAPAVRVFLTAGEYQAATRTLVGPSVGSLLETIRVDRAIVSPDGISRGFGLSFDDERAALVCRRFCEVAREVVVLADHGVVGLEAKVQAVRPDRLHTVVTDAGTLSSHRLELSGAGLQVIVVDEEEAGGPGVGTAATKTV